jgi:hypothetical protein
MTHYASTTNALLSWMMLSPLDLEFKITSHRAGTSPPNVPPSSVIVCGSFGCFHGFFRFLPFSRSQETLEPETWIPLAFVLLAITFITYLLDCV